MNRCVPYIHSRGPAWIDAQARHGQVSRRASVGMSLLRDGCARLYSTQYRSEALLNMQTCICWTYCSVRTGCFDLASLSSDNQRVRRLWIQRACILYCTSQTRSCTYSRSLNYLLQAGLGMTGMYTSGPRYGGPSAPVSLPPFSPHRMKVWSLGTATKPEKHRSL